VQNPLADAAVQSSDEARQQPVPPDFVTAMICSRANRDLRKFLLPETFYLRSRGVSESKIGRACEMLRQVFQAYLADPEHAGRDGDEAN